MGVLDVWFRRPDGPEVRDREAGAGRPMLEYIGFLDEDVTGNSSCEVRRRLGLTPLDIVEGGDVAVEECTGPVVDNVWAADTFA